MREFSIGWAGRGFPPSSRPVGVRVGRGLCRFSSLAAAGRGLSDQSIGSCR